MTWPPVALSHGMKNLDVMALSGRLLYNIGVAVMIAMSLFFPSVLCGQLRVCGVVADSLTRQAVGGAFVSFDGDRRTGVTGREDGSFSIASPKGRRGIYVRVMGYDDKYVDIRGRKGDIYLDTLFLSPRTQQLDEVVVRRRKYHYSKRNNPAVAFVECLRARRDSLDPMRAPWFSTSEYEKLVLGMVIDNAAVADTAMRRYVDYSPVTGQPYITISIKEQRSRALHRREPRVDRRVVEGYRSEGIDQSFNVENMRKIFNDILRQVNLYDNDIVLMQNRFVSPLSRIGPDFYKYYLTDTVLLVNEPCIELTFTPHNKESMGFTGRLYVPVADSAMFVRKVVMQTPRGINLNYVRNLYIVQNFERDSMGNRLKTSDQLTVTLQLLPGTPEVYARRETCVDDYSYSPVSEYSCYYDAGGYEHMLPQAMSRDENYWNDRRCLGITAAQGNMAGFMSHLRTKKLFYWGERFVSLMAHGYVRTGNPSRFDIGPLNTFISFNDVEGTRLRLGGMTTANLSRRWFAKVYGAYGFRDHKWKYGAELEYSFVDKQYHSREFPIHGLRMSYSYDLDQLGQHYLFTNQDNIFLSLKRCDNYLMTYRHLFRFDYILERRNGFSLQAGIKWERQEPTRRVSFGSAGGHRWSHYNAAAFILELRYAPGEEFYQSATMRLPINMDAPVIVLTQEFGPKGMLGADFMLNKTEVSVQKRFWFSAFGYADVILKGCKLWSTAYYPSLPWANANLSYTIQPESFALLNPMEFATDQMVGWDLTYWMNGLIFNRIPLLKKTRLREVVSFRGFYGSLTDKNNPAKNHMLPVFPSDSGTRLMDGKPYMEIGIGLDNIFTILRLDYVWRLTYRNLPGVDKSGLRLQLHFTF